MANLSHGFFLFRGDIAEKTVTSQLRVAHDHVQRRSKFMGHRRDKLRLCPVRFFELLVDISQLGGFLVDFLEEPGIFSGDTDFLSDGLDELQFVGSKVTFFFGGQVQHPDDFFFRLYRKRRRTGKSHGAYHISRTQLLVP